MFDKKKKHFRHKFTFFYSTHVVFAHIVQLISFKLLSKLTSQSLFSACTGTLLKDQNYGYAGNSLLSCALVTLFQSFTVTLLMEFFILNFLWCCTCCYFPVMFSKSICKSNFSFIVWDRGIFPANFYFLNTANDCSKRFIFSRRKYYLWQCQKMPWKCTEKSPKKLFHLTNIKMSLTFLSKY